MRFEELMAHLVIPRPNGSEGLRETASFIHTTLQAHATELELQTFTATPYGFELLMAAVLVLVLAFAVAMFRGRYGLALLLPVALSALFLLELELLWSPISGLLPLPEQNIVATFPGSVGGPTLVFGAHYDTLTLYGDLHVLIRWGMVLGVGQLVAIILPLAGIWGRRRQRRYLPRAIVVAVSVLAVVPSAVLFWLIAVPPALAKSSPGALDNGGSVAVLLRLAEDMATRPTDARTTVKLVFLASEEQRALGSRHFAGELPADAPVFVINLDNIGISNQLAYGTQEGFLLSQYLPSKMLIDLIDSTERELGGQPLLAMAYPPMAMTDARSFLALGIPALTLQSAGDGQWPSYLHSAGDTRDRVSIPALEHTLELLKAIVARVDRESLLVPGSASRT